VGSNRSCKIQSFPLYASLEEGEVKLGVRGRSGDGGEGANGLLQVSAVMQGLNRMETRRELTWRRRWLWRMLCSFIPCSSSLILSSIAMKNTDRGSLSQTLFPASSPEQEEKG
jgi:hypothetical protein